MERSDLLDGTRFDTLTRLLGQAPSRRALLPLVGGLLAAPLAGVTPVDAKKKKKKATLCLDGQTIRASRKKKKKLLKSGATPGACPSSPPPPNCTPETCGGCCDGATCHDGEGRNFCGRNGAACLQCGPNELCDGETCFCPTQCCADADCDAIAGGVCLPEGVCEYPCVPTGGTCVAGVTECCDISPLVRCYDGVCKLCVLDREGCTATVPCCDPDTSCDISSGRCFT